MARRQRWWVGRGDIFALRKGIFYYSVWPILTFTNTDVFSTKIYLDTSIFVKVNMWILKLDSILRGTTLHTWIFFYYFTNRKYLCTNSEYMLFSLFLLSVLLYTPRNSLLNWNFVDIISPTYFILLRIVDTLENSFILVFMVFKPSLGFHQYFLLWRVRCEFMQI
jgi:hypothetical protein